MNKNIIEIKELTKYYGKHKGIDGVTFSVGEGEIWSGTIKVQSEIARKW